MNDEIQLYPKFIVLVGDPDEDGSDVILAGIQFSEDEADNLSKRLGYVEDYDQKELETYIEKCRLRAEALGVPFENAIDLEELLPDEDD